MTTHKVRIGTRVHCILNGGRDGVIFRICGPQTPESCSTMSGFVVSGGSADYDIVWEDGSESLRIPEALVQRSSQWSILEGVATTEEIQSMRGLVILETQRRKDEQDEKQRRFNASVAELRANLSYAHLGQTEKDKYGSARLAAANIRMELKRTFPGIKFSVRSKVFSGGDSVDVSWADGPIVRDVDAVAKKYQSGSFNGMEDIYEYSTSPWKAVFGDAKYIQCQRSHSLEAMKQAVLEVCFQYGWELLKVETSFNHAYLPCNDHDKCRIVYDWLEKRGEYFPIDKPKQRG